MLRVVAARGGAEDCAASAAWPAPTDPGPPIEPDSAPDLAFRRVPDSTACEVDEFDPPDGEFRSPVSAAAVAQAAQKPVATAIPMPRTVARVPTRPTQAPALCEWPSAWR